jgi:hypothetical protein
MLIRSVYEVTYKWDRALIKKRAFEKSLQARYPMATKEWHPAKSAYERT